MLIKYITKMTTKAKKNKKSLKGSGLLFKNKAHSWKIDNAKMHSKSSGLRIDDIDITCNLCNHDKFTKHKVLLPGGRTSQYLDMAWLTTSTSKKLICERCSNIILIANNKVLVKSTKKKKVGKKKPVVKKKA